MTTLEVASGTVADIVKQWESGPALLALKEEPTTECPHCHGSTFAGSNAFAGLRNCPYCEPPDNPRNESEENARPGRVPLRGVVTLKEPDTMCDCGICMGVGEVAAGPELEVRLTDWTDGVAKVEKP